MNLSSRESEVLKLLLRGEKRRDVAKSLGISISTVGVHLHNAKCKLGVMGDLLALSRHPVCVGMMRGGEK